VLPTRQETAKAVIASTPRKCERFHSILPNSEPAPATSDETADPLILIDVISKARLEIAKV